MREKKYEHEYETLLNVANRTPFQEVNKTENTETK